MLGWNLTTRSLWPRYVATAKTCSYRQSQNLHPRLPASAFTSDNSRMNLHSARAYERRRVAVGVERSGLVAISFRRAEAHGKCSRSAVEFLLRCCSQPLSSRSLPGRFGDASTDALKTGSPMWWAGFAAHHCPTFQFSIGSVYALHIHLRSRSPATPQDASFSAASRSTPPSPFQPLPM